MSPGLMFSTKHANNTNNKALKYEVFHFFYNDSIKIKIHKLQSPTTLQNLPNRQMFQIKKARDFPCILHSTLCVYPGSKRCHPEIFF